MPTRTKKSDKERSYEILGRELTARIRTSGISRSLVQSESGISDSTLKAACAGTRPIPDSQLAAFVKLTAQESEDLEVYREHMRHLNKPGASITHILRGSQARLNLGYIDSPPFASASRKGLNQPTGLIIDLVELFFQLAGAQWEWHRIPFQKLTSSLETRQVDLVAGFVLEAPSRQARAKFVPLEMPFAIGVNALTRSQNYSNPVDFQKFSRELMEAQRSGHNRHNIITIEGELADEYFPAILPYQEPTIRDTSRTVSDAIKYYLNEHEDRMKNIIFADHMTCTRLKPTGTNLIFDKPVGRFRGGFLLPTIDSDWSDYFSFAYHGFPPRPPSASGPIRFGVCSRVVKLLGKGIRR